MGGEPSGPQGTAAARRPVIAVGSVAAMAATTPAPTLAQGEYVGPGGVSVDVGRPRYREHDRLWQELVVGIVGWQDILLPTWTYRLIQEYARVRAREFKVLTGKRLANCDSLRACC